MADLESRKRAPLYQKRQEEELAAAVARAAEAEERAAAADARAKDAKVPGGLQTRMQALCPDLEVTPQLHQIPMAHTRHHHLCETLLSMSATANSLEPLAVLWRAQPCHALKPLPDPEPCTGARRRARRRRSRPRTRRRSCSARSAARRMQRRLQQSSWTLRRRARLARRSRPR